MEHKPYRSLNEYYREIFGRKAAKISLDGGFTCPNRDGDAVQTAACSAVPAAAVTSQKMPLFPFVNRFYSARHKPPINGKIPPTLPIFRHSPTPMPL